MVEKRRSDDLVRYAGAAVGAVPVIGSFAQEFTADALTAVFKEHSRLRSVALRAAERSSGMSREDMSEALVRSPHLVPLVTRVLWVAGMNGQDETLQMLGGILGDIMRTPDDTEEAELILAGIVDLRRMHLQVLQRLGDQPRTRVKVEDSYEPAEQFEDSLSPGGALPDRDPDAGGYVVQKSETWNAEALARFTGLSLTRTQLALAGLVSSGFALSPPVIGGPGYVISPPGLVLWEAIQRWQTESQV